MCMSVCDYVCIYVCRLEIGACTAAHSSSTGVQKLSSCDIGSINNVRSWKYLQKKCPKATSEVCFVPFMCQHGLHVPLSLVLFHSAGGHELKDDRKHNFLRRSMMCFQSIWYRHVSVLFLETSYGTENALPNVWSHWRTPSWHGNAKRTEADSHSSSKFLSCRHWIFP